MSSTARFLKLFTLSANFLFNWTYAAVSVNVGVHCVEEVTFEPSRLRVIEEKAHVVVTLSVVSHVELRDIKLLSNNSNVAFITDLPVATHRNCSEASDSRPNSTLVSNYTENYDLGSQSSCFYAKYDVVGILPGRTTLYASAVDPTGHFLRLIGAGQNVDVQNYPVTVVRGVRPLDAALKWCFLAMLGVVTFLLSFRVEWDEIKSAIKEPIAPAVALCCQLALNPLLAYGLGRTVHLDLVYRLSLFGLSCSPPSGLSYIWAYLLGADMTMSLIAAIAANVIAFGFMSAWMYTLGRTVTNNNPDVPFFDIGVCVCVISGACILGYAVRTRCSAIRFYTMKIASVACLALISFDLACHILNQVQYFVLFADWQLVMCAIFVPYLGAFIAAITTWVCRQSWPRVKSVFIQLCLPNHFAAIAMFYLCLPNRPETDISALYVILSSTLACVPLWLGLVVHFVRRGCLKEGEVDLKSGRSSVALNIPSPLPTQPSPDTKTANIGQPGWMAPSYLNASNC